MAWGQKERPDPAIFRGAWEYFSILLDDLAVDYFGSLPCGFKHHFRNFFSASSSAQESLFIAVSCFQHAGATGQQRQRQQPPITVRVIEYAMPGLPEGAGRYRLITSLLDPATAPALELAALYHERWQVEAVFDELKTHLLQGRRVLRSKRADLVRQEFYGWVLAHYCVRWLLHQGATRHRIPHAQQSFSAHVQLLRQALPQSGAFPPAAADKAQALV